jgi:SAM-dependent methyltransferase
MRLRLLEMLRCPDCRSTLEVRQAKIEIVESGVTPARIRCTGLCRCPEPDASSDHCPDCARIALIDGVLACAGCGATFAVNGGVPRLETTSSLDAARSRTAASFGYLWSQSTPGVEMYDPTSYHFQKMEQSLSLDAPRGLVLDAGCGDGIDLANQAQRDGVEVIGVDLSEGGCRTSYARTRGLERAHVVQADLCRLPFADGTFDLAYSYGVLHHLSAPERGLAEVTRVAKQGASIVVYLYEDFSERSTLLRWSLAAANTVRAVTTRLPHGLLYSLCRLASPVMFAVFTVPTMLGRRFTRLARLTANLPFRHGTGPFSLVGDLYDRFSAPVEYRYSRESSAAFLADAGLRHIRVAAERGWMVTGTKHGEQTEKTV